MDGSNTPLPSSVQDVIIIGAGIAGLTAALRLSVTGHRVMLIDAHDHVGGKIRNVATPAGPTAAGPTVLTMRKVFDELFEFAGSALEDHVTLHRQSILARHFWKDGSQLDLLDDQDATYEAIKAFSSKHSADQFNAFCTRARKLFDAFEGPVMNAPEPRLVPLVVDVLSQPSLIPVMAPFSTLSGLLQSSFEDPRLRQLFGRYATYVGGAPQHVPAILALIWQAEASGVWRIENGIHALAQAIADLAERFGTDIRIGTPVTEILPDTNDVCSVRLDNGSLVRGQTVIYAGDPRALASGLLGEDVKKTAQQTLTTPRSFSARVHSFAAKPHGRDLAHHNVFFEDQPDEEFSDLMTGNLPRSPSFYVCAMDRGTSRTPDGLERFEIITNAPARPDTLEDPQTWHPRIMQKMARCGLNFTPKPTSSSVTTETDFSRMFPGSEGALYGQSPHQLTAALKRPTARSGIARLYLAGGGCHPGAGVPMAALSGRLAVEAILNDRILEHGLRQTAMHGGI
jgi:1-hydroxycarotenoid 3,4-desaturase